MRDPTRGGVATVLNELAAGADLAVVVEEAAVPVRPAVTVPARSWGSTLCTSRTKASCWRWSPREAEASLAALRSVPEGRDAALIGEVAPQPEGMVLVGPHLEEPGSWTCSDYGGFAQCRASEDEKARRGAFVPQQPGQISPAGGRSDGGKGVDQAGPRQASGVGALRLRAQGEAGAGFLRHPFRAAGSAVS